MALLLAFSILFLNITISLLLDGSTKAASEDIPITIRACPPGKQEATSPIERKLPDKAACHTSAHGNPTRDDAKHTLKSPRLVNWGVWSGWSYCHKGDFVIGMVMSMAIDLPNPDASGLGGLSVICGNAIGYKYRISPGPWLMGEYGKKYYCPDNNPAVGFQLKSEPWRAKDLDNVGAVDFKLICPVANGTERIVAERNKVNRRGYWTNLLECPNGTALCGFRIQVPDDMYEGPLHSFDPVGITNVDMQCCSFVGW